MDYVSNNGWLRDPQTGRAIRFVWTADTCREVAKKFASRGEFQKGAPTAYKAAYKNGWLDVVCEHMVPVANYAHKYVYEIISNSSGRVYVGVSCQPSVRYKSHCARASGQLRLLMNEPHEVVVSHVMSIDEALRDEERRIRLYRESGRDVVNISSGGSPGGARQRWTLDKCKIHARAYCTRVEFQKGDRAAYQAARKYGWLPECCSHMRPQRISWTYAKCLELASQCKTVSEFRRRYPAALSIARHNGWAKAVCAHMEPKVRSPWTLNECLEAALRFTTRSEFENGAGGAYQAARARGWMETVCQHMPKRVKRSSPASHGEHALLMRWPFEGEPPR